MGSGGAKGSHHDEHLLCHSVGVTMRAENIAMAFAGAKDYLQQRHPRSDVIVQAGQRITNEFTTPVTPFQVITTRN